MENKKKYLWPIFLGIVGLILGILSYLFYEPNIVISVALTVLGILLGFKIINKKNKRL